MASIFAATFSLFFPLVIATFSNNKTEYLINDGEYNRIISCDAKGDPIPSVSWKIDGNALDQNGEKNQQFSVTDNASLVVNNPKSNRRYIGLVNVTCIANNTNGTVQKTFNIWLIKAPRILTNNSETNINKDNIAVLLLHIPCETTGYPKPDVEWRFGEHVRNASQDALTSDKILVDPSTNKGFLPHYKVFNNGTVEILDLFSEKHLTYRNFTCVAQNIAGEDNRTHTFEILTTYKFEVTLPLKELIDLEEKIDKKIKSVFHSGKLFHSKNITSVDQKTGTVKFDLIWKEENLKKYYGHEPDRDIQKLANDVHRALTDGGLHPSYFIMNEKPAPAVMLIASDVEAKRLKLSWRNPEYFVVKSYQVQTLDGSNNKWKNAKNVDGTKTSTIVDKLKPETKYQLRLVSSNDNGVGQTSEPLLVETKADSSVTIIVVVIVVVVIIVVLVTVVVVRRYRRKKKKERDEIRLRVIPTEPENPYQVSIPGIPLENIYIRDGRTHCPLGNELGGEVFSWREIPRSNLTMHDTLGQGEFGLVSKAIWRDDVTNNDVLVAVKTVQGHATETDRKELFKELKLMADIDNPNVVNLIGACSTQGPLWIIVEFCEHGNLLTYLKKHRKSSPSNKDSFVTSLDPLTRVKFAYDVSKGMTYLEEKKIIHRDLAARNVLLGKNKIAKVSDFGLSRDIYEVGLYQKTTGGKLPVKWMALESLQDAKYTSKSDVWSFGILFWEIETAGMVPYPGISGLELKSHLERGYRLPNPDVTPPEIFDLMLKCWESSPKVRPPFFELEARLESFVEDMSGYLPVVIDEDTDNEHTYINYVQPPYEEEEEKDASTKF